MATMRIPINGGYDEQEIEVPDDPMSGGGGGLPIIKVDLGSLGPQTPFTGSSPIYQEEVGYGNPAGLAGAPIGGRSGETPREREEVRRREPPADLGPEPPSQSAPARPRVPTPQAGQTMAPPPPPMVKPFKPLPGGPGSLFGSLGGLQGGGLGVPLDPVSNQASDPISTLLELLKKG